jgi:hypothetical protein
MAARRSLTGSINNHERGHRGHDRRLHENIPSPDLNIARNPNPAEAPPCTNSPKSATQKCRSCHAEAPFPTCLLPFSNSRDPYQNCSPSLFTVGDLQCLQRCFSSCSKKVTVTFRCTYLTGDERGMQISQWVNKFVDSFVSKKKKKEKKRKEERGMQIMWLIIIISSTGLFFHCWDYSIDGCEWQSWTLVGTLLWQPAETLCWCYCGSWNILHYQAIIMVVPVTQLAMLASLTRF